VPEDKKPKTAHEMEEAFHNANPASQATIKCLLGMTLVLKNDQLDIGIRMDTVRQLLQAYCSAIQFATMVTYKDGREKFPEIPWQIIVQQMFHLYATNENDAIDRLKILMSLYPEFEGEDIEAMAREEEEKQRQRAEKKEREYAAQNETNRN
jgi:hypothetical protein